jgi:hypothetical protein
MRACKSGGAEASFTGRDIATNDSSFYASQWADDGHAGRNTALQLRVLYPADIGEVMGAAEDLWLRIARHASMRVVVVRDPMTGDKLLLLRSLTDAMDEEGCQLLEAAKDGARYQWRQNGVTGSLVSAIRSVGSTVVMELTSVKQLGRWPDGDAVEWALQSLLHRIDAQGMGV